MTDTADSWRRMANEIKRLRTALQKIYMRLHTGGRGSLMFRVAKRALEGTP